ncbi:hypothetical protein [Prosthecobacter sp.]|uniref:hypothetical protein n=1 Tax=Prosthecobacter sp. TaxID=1965333 RepID=UPI00378432D8
MKTLASSKDKPGVTVVELPSAALQRMCDRFPEGVNVLVVPPSVVQPEFIRPPKPGEVCPITGLPRTTFLELLQQAGSKNIPVRYLRKPGASTGIALVPRQPLVDYINKLPAPDWQQETEEEKK